MRILIQILISAVALAAATALVESPASPSVGYTRT
jgi:hypothetical protein